MLGAHLSAPRRIAHERLDFRRPEARADDRILLRAFAILDVGGRDDRRIGQHFESGITAISAFETVQQFLCRVAGRELRQLRSWCITERDGRAGPQHATREHREQLLATFRKSGLTRRAFT